MLSRRTFALEIKKSVCRRVDAVVPTEFGWTHELELFVTPTEEQRSLCRLVRLPSDLVVQRVQGKIRAQDLAVTEFQRGFLDEQIAQRLIVLFSEDGLTAANGLLLGIPGNGVVAAWTILAKVLNIRRFVSAKKVAAFSDISKLTRKAYNVHTIGSQLFQERDLIIRYKYYI